MASTDDWLYNDDLDVNISERDRLGSTDSRVLDGEDLLDDVLTAPATAPSRSMGHTPTNEDEMTPSRHSQLLGMKVKMEDTALEESGSARFNAEQMARTVQARIVANKTSQGVGGPMGPNIYAREPNKALSFYIGNLTWWTTDQDLILAVKEAGLGEVMNIKFFENRANGQSKGYALIELTSEALATAAAEKFQELTIHNQKPLVIYALKINAHQFETRCNQAKSGASPTFSTNNGSSASKPSRMPSAVPQAPPAAPPFRPQMPLPGLGFPPPPIPGLRPPGLPDPTAGFPGLPPPMPPMPPFPLNPLAAKGLPGMPPPFPNLPLGDPTKAGIAPHLNPAFLQEMSQGGNMAELFAQAAARFKNQAAVLSAMGGPGKQPTEEEAADANNRNRAISSSAISRAMADANAGDYDSAMDVLKMAITLIKQSVTAGTEASQILIHSLQDCVRGIEEQAANTKRSRGREHRSHDDRDRGRSSSHRSHPAKHHRDRSRERRR